MIYDGKIKLKNNEKEKWILEDECCKINAEGRRRNAACCVPKTEGRMPRAEGRQSNIECWKQNAECEELMAAKIRNYIYMYI